MKKLIRSSVNNKFHNRKKSRFLEEKSKYEDFLIRANTKDFKHTYTKYTLELSILEGMLKYAIRQSDINRIIYKINKIKKILKYEMNIIVD